MRNLFVLGLFFLCSSGFSQVNFEVLTRNFYEAINRGDSTEMVDFFHADCHIKHLGEDNVWDLPLSEFYKLFPNFKSEYYAEEVNKIEVHTVSSGLTYVDVYFEFYIEGSYSHSGIDHFCWVVKGGLLKVESLYSSVLKGDTPVKEDKKSMDVYMNKWHNDVAVFDYTAYFNFMDDTFIYLGTDPKERWTKETFSTFCKPYFERKSTWDFKTNWRNWYFSKDQKTAWFEESLNTQMEECRGSGVLIKTDTGWKIAHYNLTVVIENEKMKKFIKLRRK